MPDQTQNPANEKLEERIDQLVNEMGDATEKLREQVAQAELTDEQFDEQLGIASALSPDEALATPEPEPERQSETEDDSAETEGVASEQGTLDEQVEGMLEEAAAEESSGDQLATETQEKSAVDIVDAELSELADEMLDGDFDDGEDVLEAGMKPAETPKPTSESDSQAADSDDELDGDFDDGADVLEAGDTPAQEQPKQAESEVDAYGGADDLEGEFDDIEDVLTEGVPPKSAEQAEAAPSAPIANNDEGAPQKPEAASDPVTETAAEEAAQAKAAETGSATEGVPESEPAPAEAKPKKQKAAKQPREKRTIEVKPGTKLPRIAALTLAHAQNIGVIAVEKVNKPFDEKPAHVRDVAGWIAAVTLFNAIAVWVFMLIGRSPAPGTSAEPDVDLVGGETTAQVEPEPID